MSELIEYMIVSDDTPINLMKQVNANIKEGWVPQGGVSVSESCENIYCHQAMIRKEEK